MAMDPAADGILEADGTVVEVTPHAVVALAPPQPTTAAHKHASQHQPLTVDTLLLLGQDLERDVETEAPRAVVAAVAALECPHQKHASVRPLDGMVGEVTPHVVVAPAPPQPTTAAHKHASQHQPVTVDTLLLLGQDLERDVETEAPRAVVAAVAALECPHRKHASVRPLDGTVGEVTPHAVVAPAPPQLTTATHKQASRHQPVTVDTLLLLGQDLEQRDVKTEAPRMVVAAVATLECPHRKHASVRPLAWVADRPGRIKKLVSLVTWGPKDS
ncbi:hypothetical protein HanXRQr2_Chr03g0128961 [Helianthus annuus]|uniref:Uncharacterized protein n=1 Tax=Helianthus annuus TaxID=4232 RepID=A0A9K3JIM6_HELAN|nr:hypothetical protein HanXRQr2_Chr03g0128961 [Helianthus annuus]KAJ0945226.1 hypothetical protein HanPSC8_Chr03g0125791 [Helianthus annuus]